MSPFRISARLMLALLLGRGWAARRRGNRRHAGRDRAEDEG